MTIELETIEIETGKRYRCANGRWAFVCDDYDWRDELRFVAVIENRATPEWYTAYGLLRGKRGDAYHEGFHIVGEWREPVEVWAVVDGATVVDIFDDEPRAERMAKTDTKYRVVQLVEAS